jgi:hypothetical protein
LITLKICSLKMGACLALFMISARRMVKGNHGYWESLSHSFWYLPMALGNMRQVNLSQKRKVKGKNSNVFTRTVSSKRKMERRCMGIKPCIRNLLQSLDRILKLALLAHSYRRWTRGQHYLDMGKNLNCFQKRRRKSEGRTSYKNNLWK